MKKNMALRIAGILLVMVLITGCVVGSTFAKYITTVSDNDTARVAKWNLDLTEDGAAAFSLNIFADTYDTTVDSNDGADVVAPGTTGSIEFVIDGDSEVAYTVDGSSEYGAFKTEYTGTWATEPILFTLTQTKDSEGIDVDAAAGEVVSAGTLGELKTALDTHFDTGATISPNITPDFFGTYTLSWEWPFYVSDAADGTDTNLGVYAADTDDLDVAISFQLVMTQVD